MRQADLKAPPKDPQSLARIQMLMRVHIAADRLIRALQGEPVAKGEDDGREAPAPARRVG